MIPNLSEHDLARIMRSVSVTEKLTGGPPQLPGQSRTPIPFQFRRFRLKYVLTAGTSTTATRIEYDPVTGGWTDRDEFTVYDLVGNYAGIGDYAADGYTYNGKVGHVGAAIKFHDVDRWCIVELKQVGSGLRRFELKTALTPGSSATAYLRQWISGAWSTDTGTEFSVYDRDGKFRGRAKDEYGSPHDDGSMGVSEWVSDANRHEILDLTPHALMIQGLAYADYTTSSEPISIDNIQVMQPTGAIIVDTDPGAVNKAINNLFDHVVDENGVVIAVWNEDDADWDGLQAIC